MWLEWLKITHYTDFNQSRSVMEMSFSMSADVYSDLTIGLASKNYPKMTPHMLKSAHWLQSYDVVSGQSFHTPVL